MLINADKPHRWKADVERSIRSLGRRASLDPTIPNAHESRQLATLKRWFCRNGYKEVSTNEGKDSHAMPPGTFTLCLRLPVDSPRSSAKRSVYCAVKPLTARISDFPVLIAARTAVNANNISQRGMAEARKFERVKARYGDAVKCLLFLRGHFHPEYLGAVAAEGMDWVWEHRTSDFALLFASGTN